MVHVKYDTSQVSYLKGGVQCPCWVLIRARLSSVSCAVSDVISVAIVVANWAIAAAMAVALKPVEPGRLVGVGVGVGVGLAITVLTVAFALTVLP